MIFFVFSYNRGQFLKNCIESIEHCAPESDIIIYDDRSDDPDTCNILEDLRPRHRIVSGKHGTGDEHGGLYSNMQLALESVSGDQTLCFLQDDTQIVRRVTEDDHAFIEDYFGRHPECGFLAPVFLRKITRQRRLLQFEYQPEYQVYFCRHRNFKTAGVYYSDIFISTSQRLKNAGWHFLQGEVNNELQAKSSFIEMGYMYAPFIMWLPNGPAYRHKQKPLAYRIAEKRNRAGFYPFEYMPVQGVERLKSRPPEERPIAENFLSTVDRSLKQPWIYHPLRRSRLLRKLHELESLFRSV